MVHRAAARVSLRSRERKLRLFLELFHPGPETTVVDVGVTDAPFGDGSSDNFFEARYPWPAQITAVGNTELDRFAAAFPAVTAVRADGRELPFADGRLRPRLLERGDRARRRRARRPAAVPRRALPRRRAGLRHDPEPLVPGRPALAAAVRPLAAAPASGASGSCGRAASTTCSTPLGPRELAGLFPYPVQVVGRGLTLVAVGPL